MNFIKKLKLKNILTIVATIIFLLIVVQFFKDWSFPDTSWKIGKDERMNFKPHHQIVQKFTAQKNNLSGIEILFKSSNKVKPGGEFTLNIYEKSCSKLIRESSVKFHSLDSQDTYNFAFKKIPDSKEETFCLELNFLPIREDAKSIVIYIVENNSKDNKYLFNLGKNEKLPGMSLSMRPRYKGDNLFENIQIFVQRVSQYKPWFLKDFFLFSIFAFAIAFSLATILMLAKKSRD